MAADRDRVVVEILKNQTLRNQLLIDFERAGMGMARQAFYRWRRVPGHRALIVARRMRRAPHAIRPDIFRRPKLGSPRPKSESVLNA